MIDDGLEPVEVTDRWGGFYRHRWEQLGTYPDRRRILNVSL